MRWSSDTSRVYTILDTSSTYISNGKGVINGTTITQVDNATNSTNSTNARKLVNWYSARPTSLNAQFGDGSLRIFYATSFTTDCLSPESMTVLMLRLCMCLTACIASSLISSPIVIYPAYWLLMATTTMVSAIFSISAG